MTKTAGKIAVLAAAALIGAGPLTASAAQARGGAALAAGLIGGLAAGALIGAVVSDAQARPAYGYQSYSDPVYGYGRPPVIDRPAGYGYGGPSYEIRRPVSYGYDTPGYGGWHRHCARDYGGW